jgi:sulfide:quinone oxidoreductase
MMHRIIILGAGFAALTAARALRAQSPDALITLIAPKAEFVYLPGLIWIPTGMRSRDDLVVPLNYFMQKHDIHFLAASVTGLEAGGRTVMTTQGPVENDGLIIATGGQFIKKLPGIEHTMTLCEGIVAAEKIRERLLAMDSGHIALGFGGNPQEPSAARGGPMFELLFGIDTWLRQQGKRDRINLTFFNAMSKPGVRLGENAVKGLLSRMAKLNINTHLGYKPLSFSADGVETDGGHIKADLVLFMPGLTGSAWLDNSTLPRSTGGFIQADEYCAIAGFERVFVAGDIGSYPGPDWLPKQGHMADLQAKVAVANLLLTLQGQPAVHRPKNELICIVDTLNQGMLVYRDEKRAFITPPLRVLNWAKRWFEIQYLKAYRDPN